MSFVVLLISLAHGYECSVLVKNSMLNVVWNAPLGHGNWVFYSIRSRWWVYSKNLGHCGFCSM